MNTADDDGPRPAALVAVSLPPVSEDLGEWLNDAAAFDAARVTALWVLDAGDADVLTLTAALAVVTFRARLVIAAPAEPHPHALATIQQLARGRLTLIADTAPDPGIGVMRPTPDLEATFTEPRTDGAVLRWTLVDTPQGRTAWRTMQTEAAERGVDGLVLPADALLLDLLRNPDEPEGRRDLHLAQG